MANENNIKIVTGEVRFCGKQSNSDKKQIAINITDAQAEKIAKALDLKGFEDGVESNPIKLDENGQAYFKAHTSYDIAIFHNGEEQIPDDEDSIKFNQIGKESKVQISFTIKEITYRKKLYQVAYLKSINVLDFVEYSTYNAFDANDVEEF